MKDLNKLLKLTSVIIALVILISCSEDSNNAESSEDDLITEAKLIACWETTKVTALGEDVTNLAISQGEIMSHLEFREDGEGVGYYSKGPSIAFTYEISEDGKEVFINGEDKDMPLEFSIDNFTISEEMDYSGQRIDAIVEFTRTDQCPEMNESFSAIIDDEFLVFFNPDVINISKEIIEDEEVWIISGSTELDDGFELSITLLIFDDKSKSDIEYAYIFEGEIMTMPISNKVLEYSREGDYINGIFSFTDMEGGKMECRDGNFALNLIEN
jgi:hypothetical protein